MLVSFAIFVALPVCAVSIEAKQSSSDHRVLEVSSSGAVNATEAKKPTCCCNMAEPLGPNYLCYNKRTGEVTTTASTGKRPKGSFTTLTNTPQIRTSSKCGRHGAVVQVTEERPADQSEISALKKAKHLDHGLVLEAYVEAVTHPWERYVFPEKKLADKMFHKYSSTNVKHFADVHIKMNGIVYGPHDTQKSVSDSLHGMPVCVKWQKTAKQVVSGFAQSRLMGLNNAVATKPSFDIKKQEWTFGTSCTETYTCIEYKMGHACGFDHQDVIFLKHKGRADGVCNEEKCGSGMFHEKGNCNLAGTCSYYFCDCRDASPDQCASYAPSSAGAGMSEAVGDPSVQQEANPFAAAPNPFE